MTTLTNEEIPPMENPSIQKLYELQDVTRVFRTGGGEVRAISDVNLEIYPGELISIEGPSGSGKTTLLQVLGALDKATSGTVRFGETELTEIDDKELTELRARDLGFVFQSFNLIPTLTAAENVEAALVTVAHSKKERRARVDELLEVVGLSERRDHLPTRLSGGEQQRVAIARALANGPRVILADEPTGNLDSETAREVVSVLRKLSTERGVTVIIVTHAEEVARMTERRIRMLDGRMLNGNGDPTWNQ
ncbi:MAG: ABC transporter ATP-binding protein [Actinobacteria bacterium]|nr:ABC transporter ATP-binding protein [Actinomycetota bacterium]